MFTVDLDLAAFDRAAGQAAAFVEEEIVPDLVGALGLHILGGAIRRSRVDTGWYRLAWMLEINAFSNEIPPAPPKGSRAAAPDPRAQIGKANRLGRGDFITISNNLAYAPVREWGSETQPPDLTMTRAIEETLAWSNGLGELEGGAVGSAA